jgi:hypothetical protein
METKNLETFWWYRLVKVLFAFVILVCVLIILAIGATEIYKYKISTDNYSKHQRIRPMAEKDLGLYGASLTEIEALANYNDRERGLSAYDLTELSRDGRLYIKSLNHNGFYFLDNAEVEIYNRLQEYEKDLGSIYTSPTEPIQPSRTTLYLLIIYMLVGLIVLGLVSWLIRKIFLYIIANKRFFLSKTPPPKGLLKSERFDALQFLRFFENTNFKIKTFFIFIGVLSGISLAVFLGYGQYKIYQNNQAQREKEVLQQIESIKNGTEQARNDLERQINEKNRTNNGLAEIIKAWEPRIAFLECEFEAIDNVQMGSGMLFPGLSDKGSVQNVGAVVITNKHVLTYQDVFGADRCKITFPGQKALIVENDIEDGTISSYGDMDFGSIALPPLNPSLETLASQQPLKCNSRQLYGEKRVPIGEEIVILGYPGIGSQDSITATEGIISGYEGDYYVTSAKVEHGNSGGAAILVKDNCFLGIPTFAVTGGVESLSRILNVDSIFYSY